LKGAEIIFFLHKEPGHGAMGIVISQGYKPRRSQR